MAKKKKKKAKSARKPAKAVPRPTSPEPEPPGKVIMPKKGDPSLRGPQPHRQTPVRPTNEGLRE